MRGPLGIVGSTRVRAVLMLLLVNGAVVALGQAPDRGRHDLHQDSKVWIEGGSNLGDWSCTATTVEARIEADPSAGRDESSLAGLIRRVSVKTAVHDLKCGNKRMEKDLYRALKADDPSVPSHIVGVFSASSGSKDSAAVETEGSITVAGVEKSVHVRIALERLADGTIKARGAVPLLMTNFGVTPPTGLFGLVRSHNEIVVKFELVISPP